MKLVEVSDDFKSRIFTGVDKDGIIHTFVVKYFGKDGGGLDIWSGKMKEGDAPSVPVTMVVHDDGNIVAVNLKEPSMALQHIIKTNRKAYGPSILPERSFEVRRYNGMKLENYA